MPQDLLPYKYEKEATSSGMTAFAGLPACPGLAQVMGFAKLAERFLGLRNDSQGWTDEQMVQALILLKLAGGDCVENLKILEADQGTGASWKPL